ncbi:hypothetical protein HS088_TW09G00891 [Tripterygium wilfordii]|uniref:WEB family protein n=1 Tax=Tripterygium wilfordii TaxID=458696 RepID=A0A7J7D8Y5_TRIWF|nr:WEB family protein At1g12150-like [Tripterygium wilfordii]KAF5742830.1 hypothetical protein HS088_TW09G00891 [Tripterygium wilfordii]
MVSVRIKELQKPQGSPRTEIGEIDTRAPFQSVKAAVSLFAEVALNRRKPNVRRSRSLENVIDKEAQLLLAQKQLTKIKQKLETAETTKARALTELERVKRIMEDLTNKLKTVSESKISAVEATEAVKRKGKLLQEQKSQKHFGNVTRKHELQQAREQYLAAAAELDAAKQDLNKIRQDFNAALEAKSAAFQQAAKAQHSVNMNAEKVSEVSKEISAMNESIQQLKLASQQAEQEQAKIAAEKETRIQTCKTCKDEAEKQLLTLKNEYDPELTRTIEAKLAETNADIGVLQEEMKNVHASKMNHVRVVTTELDDATRRLQEVAEEERSLQSFVSTLKLELENVKKEHVEFQEKQAAAEQKETDQLLFAAENAHREAEELQRTTEELKHEAETAQRRAAEAESKLQLALKEAEGAREAEKRVHDEIKVLIGTQQTPQPDSPAKIKISKEEFESLKGKQEECNNLAEMKVAAVMVQLEIINANKDEAEEKLEAGLKAIEEIKEATDLSLKAAENASAAQCMVEGELQKWRQEEETVA